MQHWLVVLLAAASVHGLAPLLGSSSAQPFSSMVAMQRQTGENPSSANCTWQYFSQILDHFNTGNLGRVNSYNQRYCVFDGYYYGSGPLLFYTGNESPVEVYINNTGMMWDLAKTHSALIVFAEHRYFGESVPDLLNIPNCMSYLTSAQALADYAHLIKHITTNIMNDPGAPVVAFGGSYGGMLSAWMRLKYPSVVRGAIAASAPVWGFPSTVLSYSSSFIPITTAASDASPQCVTNALAAWILLNDVARYDWGRKFITEQLRLCTPVTTPEDALSVVAYLQDSLFILAEGNFPFETNYISFAVESTSIPLPAWPMRVACRALSEVQGIQVTGDRQVVQLTVQAGHVIVRADWNVTTPLSAYTLQDLQTGPTAALFQGVRELAGTLYNLTGEHKCYPWQGQQASRKFQRTFARNALQPDADTSIQNKTMDQRSTCTQSTVEPLLAWQALVCNEGLNLVPYVVRGTGGDMYWPPNAAINYTRNDIDISLAPQCASIPASLPGTPTTNLLDSNADWATLMYGGRDLSAASNIFFTNGEFDPWTGGGVTPSTRFRSSLPPSVQSVTIAQGAHHLDLFFATSSDPDSVKQVRAMQATAVAQWIAR